MEKNLQIICDKEDWDNSTIVACGFKRNGRQAIPVRFKANTLEEPWISIWHGIVHELEGLDPDGWAAKLIRVDKMVLTVPVEPSEIPAEPMEADEATETAEAAVEAEAAEAAVEAETPEEGADTGSSSASEPEPAPVLETYLRLIIHRQWDDNTTAEPVLLDITDEHAIELFDFLTRDDQPVLA